MGPGEGPHLAGASASVGTRIRLGGVSGNIEEGDWIDRSIWGSYWARFASFFVGEGEGSAGVWFVVMGFRLWTLCLIS